MYKPCQFVYHLVSEACNIVIIVNSVGVFSNEMRISVCVYIIMCSRMSAHKQFSDKTRQISSDFLLIFLIAMALFTLQYVVHFRFLWIISCFSIMHHVYDTGNPSRV